MDVEVEELWTITVDKTPIIRPAMGLERIAPSANTWPVILPDENYNIDTPIYEEKIHYLQEVENLNSLDQVNIQKCIIDQVNISISVSKQWQLSLAP